MRFKKASFNGAFFIACFLHLLPLQASTARTCSDFSATETAVIQHVHDGDTVMLTDRRKVRLIGIDTPELARQRKNKDLPAQPFAIQARDFVRQLIARHGPQVKLMPGKEPKDRYGRHLFHIQLADGSLLQSHLINNGLAIAFTTAPNNRLSGCYQSQENDARSRHRGFWSLPKYQLQEISELAVSTRGFRRVKGRVNHVGESKKAWWLNFENNFAIRIDKRNLHLFSFSPASLKGKTIAARGWIKSYKSALQMSVRHPDAIENIQ